MDNNLTNDFEVRMATLAAMEGDMTLEYANIFEVDKAILKKVEEGGMGVQIDDTEVSTGKVWSSYKTNAEIQAASSGDYLLINIGDTWTQAMQDQLNALVTKYGTRLQNHLFYNSTLVGNYYLSCISYKNGNATFLEMYNEQLFYSTINLNLTVGDTIELGTRDCFLNSSEVYNRDHIDASVNSKQDTLVSGTNIKTINNNSILGSGNIEIQGGGGAGVVELTQAEYDALAVKDPSIIYNITDATAYVMEDYATKAAVDASWGTLSTTYNPYNTTTPISGGYYLPVWNARGQITGTGNYLYQRSFSINGNSQTIFGTGSGSLTGVYAATTAGTAGQVLQSTGSGAPQWVDFRSDATYYISEADCSTGTYSNDIASFYADCIANQKVGPMQLVNNTSHNIGTPGDSSVSQVLNTDAYFVVRNGSTATFTYNGHTITIDANGNISDPDVTEVISKDDSITTFGYHTFKNAETISVTAGDVYLITRSVVASQSYYYPSSTRMFSGNVELWFFTTENGATWNNLHILITNNAVTADSTSGTFGN